MRLSLAIARGILRDARARRNAMFATVVAALVLLFLGATLLGGWLAARPLLFLLYWLLCGWLTLCAVLMSLYDMLALRRAELRRRRELRMETPGADEPGGEGRGR